MKYLNSFLFLSIIFFGACSSIKVTSDYDKEADFTKYKTFEYYGWTDESDKILNRFQKERIEKAFGDEFAKRGLKFVEGNGDMVVSLYVVVDQKTSTTAYTNHYGGGGYGYGGMGWHGGYGGGYGKMIWQSVGQKTVEENPKKAESNTPKVAAAIMKPFPIKPLDKK